MFLIAEAGVNHNGSIALARQLIEVAAVARADAVKFQSFSAAKLVTKKVQKAKYQKENFKGDDDQYSMLKNLEVNQTDMFALSRYCEELEIEFMSTPFDIDNLKFLTQEIGLKHIKLPSGEIVNGPLLLNAARTGIPVIISTGMCTLEEVIESLSLIAWGMENEIGIPSGRAELMEFRQTPDWLKKIQNHVSVLHCVTQYPAPVEMTNLKAMDHLKDVTGLRVGLSDHSEGYHIPIAAVARGATIIEKHFTLSRSMTGPDHFASLEPNELKQMVTFCRETKKALGNYHKKPNSIELENMKVARGSLVANSRIVKGETFNDENITIKRAETGISPLEYWDYISGKIAECDYIEDQVIKPSLNK